MSQTTRTYDLQYVPSEILLNLEKLRGKKLLICSLDDNNCLKAETNIVDPVTIAGILSLVSDSTRNKFRE